MPDDAFCSPCSRRLTQISPKRKNHLKCLPPNPTKSKSISLKLCWISNVTKSYPLLNSNRYWPQNLVVPQVYNQQTEHKNSELKLTPTSTSTPSTPSISSANSAYEFSPMTSSNRSSQSSRETAKSSPMMKNPNKKPKLAQESSSQPGESNQRDDFYRHKDSRNGAESKMAPKKKSKFELNCVELRLDDSTISFARFQYR